MHAVHFLRPEWLWGLLPVFALILLIAKRGVAAQLWESVCDAHLLPHVLVGTGGAGHRLPLRLLGLGWVVAVVALAGPVWSQLPQPVFRAEAKLVLVLDLSRSMDVQDVAPSRLTRAKHKILDILNAQKEGQTGLVVYAGEAFVVSPLSDDANTMMTLVQSLETDLMPLQGSRSDLALRKAEELLEQVGETGGDVLLLTDDEGDPVTLKVVENLRRQGRRISVLGFGTVDGAPIPEPGGFMKDQDGVIVIPKLDMASLQAIARAGGGQYATVTLDDQDINQVLPSNVSRTLFPSSTSKQRTTDIWREEGPWLVLLILALALPAFRPGWLGMFLAFLLIPHVSEAFSWENLWTRPDQQGVQALEQNAPEKAAALFQDPAWKGVANYRAGKYQEAEGAFATVDSPEGHYNRGNALAHLGRYEDALASYQTALTQEPHHEDARHNMEVIKKLLGTQTSPTQDGQSSQQPDASSSKQENDGKVAGGEGEKSEQAQDSTREQSNSGEGDAHDGNHEESQPVSRSASDPSSQSQSENDQKVSGEPIARETQEREPSTFDQSKQPVSAPSSIEEKAGDQQEKSKVASAASVGQTSEKEKSEQALQQWLRRIPDDPGGLLRRKFLLEHQRRVESGRPIPPQGRRW